MKLTALGGLVLANLVLAGGLVFLWLDPDRLRWDEPAPVVPSLQYELEAARPQAAEVSRYRETIERPLFADSRRPATPAAEDETRKAEIDPLKEFRLLGLYGAGNRGGVIIDHGGQVRRVPFGDKVGGWTVTGGEAGGASFARGNSERRELHIALHVGPERTAASGDAASPSAVSAASDARSTAADRTTQRRQEINELRRRRIEERRAARSAAGGAAPSATPAESRSARPSTPPSETPSATLGPIERLR